MVRLVRLAEARGPDVMSADAPALAAFDRQAAVAALRRLPRRQREAVVLRYYGDFTLEEMARAMGVSVGTAKSNLARGRDALARSMTVEPVEEDPQ